MPKHTVNCFSCGKVLEFDRSIGRTDTCSQCDADLKVCLNCRHHDRAVSEQCREPTAEFVSNKERANFCGAFQPSGDGNHDAGSGLDDAKAKLEALFKS